MIKPLKWKEVFIFSIYDKEILLVSWYDIIMKLSECSELSEDYIAEMPVKLGLVQLFKVPSPSINAALYFALDFPA